MLLFGVSASNSAPFWGSNMLQRGIMLVKYTTLWLFTHPLSPCNLYVLFTSYFRLFTLALNSDIVFFFYHVHNVMFNACMYACSTCMYVKYTLVCIPHRDIYHTLSVMVRSINTIFQDNTEQYTLCCAAGAKRSNSRGPAAPRETVGPRTRSTFTPLQ